MDESPKLPAPKRPYLRPSVRSMAVFEASLACVKVPGTPMCQFNVARGKS